MAEPAAFKYRAFISYSHADTAQAKRLHRALESFRIDKDLAGRETATGAIPKALRPIFRDRDEFTAGHVLSDQTQAALDASQALIVICSPASAKSRYVNEEIRLFKSRHAERPVIPLIVAGKPGDSELECFPPALKFKLDADGQVTEEVGRDAGGRRARGGRRQEPRARQNHRRPARRRRQTIFIAAPCASAAGGNSAGSQACPP